MMIEIRKMSDVKFDVHLKLIYIWCTISQDHETSNAKVGRSRRPNRKGNVVEG